MGVEAILAIIGGIALLVGIFGGGVKAKEIEIPPLQIGLRFVSVLIGIALIVISIFLSRPDLLPAVPQPQPEVIQSTRKPTVIQVSPQNSNELQPQLLPTTFPTQPSVIQPTPQPIVIQVSPQITKNVAAAAASPFPTKAPFMYDDFNNSEYNQDFNHYLWEFWHQNYEGIIQEDGLLRMQSNVPTSVIARKYTEVSLTIPTSFETKIRLADTPVGGSATLQLFIALANNSYWGTQCGLLIPDIAFCELGVKENGKSLYVKRQKIDAMTWHTFRIEIDPGTTRIDYYLDDEFFGNANIPVTENGRYSLVIGIFPVSGNTLAYFDDVGFGSK